MPGSSHLAPSAPPHTALICAAQLMNITVALTVHSESSLQSVSSGCLGFVRLGRVRQGWRRDLFRTTTRDGPAGRHLVIKPGHQRDRQADREPAPPGLPNATADRSALGFNQADLLAGADWRSLRTVTRFQARRRADRAIGAP